MARLRSFRILVTGSRDWTDMVTVNEGLRWAYNYPEGSTAWGSTTYGPEYERILVEGCASGADALAEQIGVKFGFKIEHHPAKWDHYGKAAGVIRNAEMLASGINQCIAFHEDLSRSKGTLNMVELCLRAGVPVRLYPRA